MLKKIIIVIDIVKSGIEALKILKNRGYRLIYIRPLEGSFINVVKLSSDHMNQIYELCNEVLIIDCLKKELINDKIAFLKKKYEVTAIINFAETSLELISEIAFENSLDTLNPSVMKNILNKNILRENNILQVEKRFTAIEQDPPKTEEEKTGDLFRGVDVFFVVENAFGYLLERNDELSAANERTSHEIDANRRMITQLEENIERNENRISELKQEILEAEKRKAQIESRLMDIQRGTDGQRMDSEIERRLQAFFVADTIL